MLIRTHVAQIEKMDAIMAFFISCELSAENIRQTDILALSTHLFAKH